MKIAYWVGSCLRPQQEQSPIREIHSVQAGMNSNQHPGATGCRALRVRSLASLILCAFVAGLSVVPTAWSAGASHPAEQYVEGEAIVTFKPSADLAAAQQD
jgi:hypothetical protein